MDEKETKNLEAEAVLPEVFECSTAVTSFSHGRSFRLIEKDHLLYKQLTLQQIMTQEHERPECDGNCS